MSKESITKRFEEYQALRREQNRAQELALKAARMAPELFDKVLRSIATYINESNAQFQQYPSTSVRPEQAGSSVWRFERDGFPLPPLEVSFDRGQHCIRFGWANDPLAHTPPYELKGVIMMRTDPATEEVMYVVDDIRTTSDSDAIAEIILDHILPGPRDFDRK